MPDQDYLPTPQTVTVSKGDEVIFPFVGDPTEPIAGYTFQATYTPWGQTSVRLTCAVNEGTNTVSVTIGSVQSGSLVIRRYSSDQHQRTVAVVEIKATDPDRPPTR